MSNKSKKSSNLIRFLSDRDFKIDRDLLGNKGANLCDLKRMNLPVPEGFVLTTDVWQDFCKRDCLSEGVKRIVRSAVSDLERRTGKKLGDEDRPLVLATRSGSRYSMPGMMDTVLNVGLSELTLASLGKQIGRQSTLDSYRRFIQMLGNSACGVDLQVFDEIVMQEVEKHGLSSDIELSVSSLETIVEEFTRLIKQESGKEIPDDPLKQLELSIEAVLRSWSKAGVESFRRYSGVPEDLGTAVLIQEMVFGNQEDSGTGVLFTRNPQTGSDKPVLEFLRHAQGEDVVGGLRRPMRDGKFGRYFGESIKNELLDIGRKLEKHYQFPQDIEFTVEKGKLFILQTRNLKLSGKAAFAVTSSMLGEGLVSENEAVRMIRPEHIVHILEDRILDDESAKPFAQGTPASVGAATGNLVLSKEELDKMHKDLKPAILVTDHIDPNDVETLFKSDGVVTTKGGAASHMAIVMRVASVPGIVGMGGIEIDEKKGVISAGKAGVIRSGAPVTIDGGSGDLFAGRLKIEKGEKLSSEEDRILKLREKVLGASPWSASCYKVGRTYRRNAFLEKIQEVSSKSKWHSKKAKVVEIMNSVVPQSELIQYTVVSPNSVEDIRGLLLEALEEGYEGSVRTCYFPEELSTPYVMGIKSEKDIEQFISGDYPGKFGGLKEWIKVPQLEAVLVGKKPVGLEPENAHEHFVFTVSFLGTIPPKIVVSINLETFHLRSFERSESVDTIVLEGVVNQDSPKNLGDVQVRSRSRHKYADLVIESIQDVVFDRWWNPPFTLPHMMCALDDGAGMSVLECQGRIKNSKIEWIKVYGAKGSEEKERVLKAQT